MRLDVGPRAALARDLLAALEAAEPGSRALPRGSLAAGRGDPYSDIDLLWEVPDGAFARCVEPPTLAATLARVGPVESLRFDPDFRRSAKRRLAFVRFAGLPLFWRLDLDIMARSVGRDEGYDRDNPAARDPADWSGTESALANAVAAVKAHLRRDDGEARRLLVRAYERIDLTVPDRLLPQLILHLVEEAQRMDPAVAGFAGRIARLVGEAF